MTDLYEQRYYSLLGGRQFRTAMTVDPDVVDLYWYDDNPPLTGFEKVAPNIYIRHTPLVEVDSVHRVEWFAEYRGEPFKVTAGRGDRLLLYYLGGSEPKTRELGLDVEERFVATGLIAKSDVENLREVDTVVWPEEKVAN
ncbi:hypothetical protein [Kutzneria buriramensis]|uniref:Uncharacterized protein n=1 Tax=Kutzneria buriramensis TaxID=1045776 RepID=A0A3E0HUI3_9PSEU|nr:hypothetical protein [Kutzneria buriramensis]REH50117.1 hypothetical protein BCF44_104390 [Kutzneria buriramensis]